MRVTKMHGLGNDYVYVLPTEERDWPALSVRVSDRHFGVGSDGLILALPSKVADMRMRMFNADGSEAEMCGNGVRCVAKFAYDRLGLCRPDETMRLVRDHTTWLGGRLPVNPSGGLIARGHPLGATGVAQVVELAWQMEDRCGARQVPSARLGLAHSVGGWIGSDVGTCCIHIIAR